MKDASTGGDNCAIRENGRSLGAYQIMEAYYNDAVEFNPRLRDERQTYENVWGKGGSDYSEEVIMSYMGRYATPKRLGRDPTYEDIARIHNGGPCEYERNGTIPYWNKVKSRLSNENNKQVLSGIVCNPVCNTGECCNITGVCNCLTKNSRELQPCNSNGLEVSGMSVAAETTIIVVAEGYGLYVVVGSASAIIIYWLLPTLSGILVLHTHQTTYTCMKLK